MNTLWSGPHAQLYKAVQVIIASEAGQIEEYQRDKEILGTLGTFPKGIPTKNHFKNSLQARHDSVHL
jgi:hypothetical protein